MIKDIKYSGLSAVPSDYDSPDGELALSLNLLNEGEGLKTINPPHPLFSGLSPHDKVFLHKSSSFGLHYICWSASSQKLYWRDSDFMKDSTKSDILLDCTVNSVEAIGDTISILTPEGVGFAIWKDGSYSYLGNRPPLLDISLGLCGSVHNGLSDKMEISFPGISGVAWEKIRDQAHAVFDEYSGEESKRIITDAVMGALLKHIKENFTEKGYFLHPFFIRYAYCLYDGSYAWHSAPVLLIPNTEILLRIDQCKKYTNDIPYVVCYLDNARCSLTARIFNTDWVQWNKWYDIVKSVDFFISPPLYLFDQSKEIIGVHSDSASFYPFNGLGIYSSNISKAQTFHYCPSTVSDDWCKRFNFAPPSKPLSMQVEDQSAFYFIHSIPIKDLYYKRKNRFFLFGTDEESLIDKDMTTLLARKVLPDDFHSHRTLIPSGQYIYNSRLHLSGLTIKAPEPFPIRTCCQCPEDVEEGPWKVWKVRVWLKKAGKKVVVESALDNEVGENSPFCVAGLSSKNFPFYLYYPDPDAYQIQLVSQDESITLPLTSSSFLNGSFWSRISDLYMKGCSFLELRDTVHDETDPVFSLFSSIYVSDPVNPFVFPASSVVSVPVGRVFTIKSAAKALSQGQFGQFPLYAFTDEGVWALEHNAEGKYISRQPITRDVCVNPDGITQIDSAVLFPTDRGIMLISGSQTQCISDMIANVVEFDMRSLPGMDQLHALLGHDSGDSCFPVMPFLDFLSQCGMIYDYVHQRIIVFNKNFSYAYVYSLKSKQWGMTYSKIADTVNSYPEALAIDTAGNLFDFSKESEVRQKGLLVTRPLKLGEADMLKTIDTVIQRGSFRKGSVRSVLYGSRDLYNWHLVNSSVSHRLLNRMGSPYKYFRIALVCDLDADESISGSTVKYERRMNAKPR